MLKKVIKILAKIAFLVSIIVLILDFIFSIYVVILPVNSFAHHLTFVTRDSRNTPNGVVIKQYEEDSVIRMYELKLNVQMYFDTSQNYKLPKDLKGTVEVVVSFDEYDDINVMYDAQELYKKGLLILTDYYWKNDNHYGERTTHLISKGEVFGFFGDKSDSKWKSVTTPPKLELFVKTDFYHMEHDGWKDQNKWVLIE